MNYAVNDSEIESTIEQIVDYNFKQERKIIYTGAAFYESLGYEEWKERCQNLLLTFFSSAGQFSGVITFPDTRVTTQGETWESAINTLRDWCAISNSGQAKNIQEDAIGLIIRNYNLKSHLNFCGITDDKIKALLTFKDFDKMENVTKFLVFNPAEKIMLTIRMVKSQDHGQLKCEVSHCIDDVYLLSFLLKDELKHSEVIVTGLVVYSGENTHSQSGCVECHNFIVSSKIFKSVLDFLNFWKSFVSQNVFKMFTSRLQAKQKSDKTILFEAVASKIVGYLAHLQFKILEKPVLPVPEKEPTGNIKQAELLLDRCQMEIAYSDNKRIFLTGNYGTGKTVVALKKLDLLYEDLKEKEVIYYVNFAKKSQLHLEVMEKNKTKEKVKVIKGGTSLSNIINSKILPEEQKNNTESVNLIVDEYDSQDLSKEESASLHQIFQEQEQFKHSTVLIAVQPLEIDRIDYFTTAGKEKEYTQAKHTFGKLKEIMKFFKLRHVMRTTVEINNLIELTQSYLNNKTNKYEEKQRNYVENREESAPEEIFPKSQQESSKAINNTENNEELLEQNLRANSAGFNNIVPGFSSASSIQASPVHSQEILDYDELFKLTFTTSKKKKRNLRRVVTKYRYTCDSEIGHGINGPLPKLIKLQKSSDSCDEFVLIAFLLLEIIKIQLKSIAIIHFDKSYPLWFQLLFKVNNFFPGVTVTNNAGEFLRSSSNMVLVNNYNCVKGLEFSEVLLILDADEYHLKQFIPEAMARSMNNLSILVRSEHRGNHRPDTVRDSVRHWEQSNEKKIMETGKSILKILEFKFCSNFTFKKHENRKQTHCQTDSTSYISYKIHRKCKRYRDITKVNQNSYPNLYLEEKKIIQEAKVV